MNKKFFQNKKIVITGGNGFFGKHIQEKLKSSNAKVFIPDRNSGLDFRRYEDCTDYFNQTKPDIVINCAANQGGIGFHKGRQADLYMDNVLMGNFLLKAAYENGVKKFINIVAGCSYPGYTEKEELKEDEYWDGEIHDSIYSYGFARKTSVVYGKALFQQYGFSSIHLIFANMYGPGEHFNPEQSKALAAMIKKIYEAKKDNKPFVEIWGTGKPIRDWLYVKDGAEAVLLATENYNDISPLNIGSGSGISVTDLATTIKNIIGYQGEFKYNTDKPDGAMKKIFSVEKMNKELNWVPTTTLEQGIKETIDWFDKNYEYAIKN